MIDKPDITDIQWASNNVTDLITGVNNKIEPATIKKTNGWNRLEKPPREYDNFLKNQYYLWFQFFNQFAIDFFYGQTTGAAEEELFLNEVTNSRLEINADSMITFEAIINAILDDASQCKSWKIKNDIIRSTGGDPYILIQEKEVLNTNNWDVTSAVYLQEFSVAAKEANATGLFFRADGLKMYTIGEDGDSVDEYDLSTAWDVTSAVYLQEFDVSPKETFPQGLFFRADGLKMYTCGIGGAAKTIDEYDLSTAWDVTSAVWLQELDVAAKETGIQGVFFRADGLKMYTIGDNGKTVDEYDLSTAWDITSAVYLQEFSVAAKEAFPNGVFFRVDGLKMYTIGPDGDSVDEYDLPLNWDVNFEADVTNNALVPKVIGEASKTIDWKIKLEKLENEL